MAYSAKRVINGTYGELSLDNTFLAECFGLEAKLEFTKEDVTQCGSLMQGSKVTGMKGTGTVKLHHVTSYMSKKVSDCAKKGQFPSYTIVSALNDPDSFGEERVRITGVTFDEATLADWEAGNLGEQSYGFTFTGWEWEKTNHSGHISDRSAID